MIFRAGLFRVLSRLLLKEVNEDTEGANPDSNDVCNTEGAGTC